MAHNELPDQFYHTQKANQLNRSFSATKCLLLLPKSKAYFIVMYDKNRLPAMTKVFCTAYRYAGSSDYKCIYDTI